MGSDKVCNINLRSASDAKTGSYNKGDTKATVVDLVDYQLSDELDRFLSLFVMIYERFPRGA